jgi:hypothetical protein
MSKRLQEECMGLLVIIVDSYLSLLISGRSLQQQSSYWLDVFLKDYKIAHAYV